LLAAGSDFKKQVLENFTQNSQRWIFIGSEAISDSFNAVFYEKSAAVSAHRG
jgi:hypothetical protein